MGKLIIIEGRTDGVGKETQTKKLYERLVAEGFNVKKITFPNYGTAGCAAVESYLNGDLGTNPDEINPFAVSAMFANDRFFSFVQDWGKFYNEGGIIISDRYTTSNMLHQSCKIENMDEKNLYLDWLYDLEFNKYKLPVPDMVVFLDVPLEQSTKLMKDRKNKINGEESKDIHESDLNYLKACSDNADYIANKYNWERIDCIFQDQMKSIDDIHNDIYDKVTKKIKTL